MKNSAYWHVMKDRYATTCPPEIQAYATGIIDVEQLEKHAQCDAARHRALPEVEAIVRNLVCSTISSTSEASPQGP